MPDDRASTAALKGSNPPLKKGKGGKKAVDNTDNKSEFVRRYPKLPPKEIVAKGEEQGLKLTAGYVSSVRSKDKAAGKNPKRRGKAARSSGGEAEFRRALQGITLARAREIIDEVTEAYEG